MGYRLAGIGSGPEGPVPLPAPMSPALMWGLRILATVGTTLAVIHGGKRNNWRFWPTFGWAVFGFVLPPVAVTVALVQGFGKAKKG